MTARHMLNAGVCRNSHKATLIIPILTIVIRIMRNTRNPGCILIFYEVIKIIELGLGYSNNC